MDCTESKARGISGTLEVDPGRVVVDGDDGADGDDGDDGADGGGGRAGDDDGC